MITLRNLQRHRVPSILATDDVIQLRIAAGAMIGNLCLGIMGPQKASALGRYCSGSQLLWQPCQQAGV